MNLSLNKRGILKGTVIEDNNITEIYKNKITVNPNLIDLSVTIASYTPYNTYWNISGSTLTSTRNTSNSQNILTLSGGNVSGSVIAGVKTLSGFIKVNGRIPTTNYFNGLASTYGNTLVKSIYNNETGFFSITQTYVSSSTWIIHANTTENNTSGSVVTIDKLKLETGTVATPWCPHVNNTATSGSSIYYNPVKTYNIYEY